MTPTEYPGLLEPALGGLDTTTRWQTVWQVRVLGNVGANATCATPDEDLNGWVDEIAPSIARLSTGTIDIEDPEDPCLVPPTEGYTGIENQFYRVELHRLVEAPEGGAPPDPADQGNWLFKFSRENASVRASVTAIGADSESVTVGRIGRDEVLRFRPGDWVEITDDFREFNHRSGQMLRVADVDPETREIEFESAIDTDLIPAGDDNDNVTLRHTRLIRWDQRGVIRLDDGSEWADLDAADATGLIPVPPDDRSIVLENGITVSFTTADGPGAYREMDHWRFAARTAGTQIEILRTAPPDGIQRHYTRLALVTPGGPNQPGQVLDCRTFWPPLFEGGEGCACTVCVTAQGHNSGQLTIQNAIDQVGALGGTVCLEAGFYVLSEPVRIVGRGAITLVGQGLGTILLYQGAGGAVQVQGSVDVQLERFTVLAAPQADANGNMLPVHGVASVNTALLAVRRLAVLVASPNPEDRFDFGIALDGMQLGAKIEECVSIAPHAIGSRASYGRDDDGDLTFVAFAELRVLDCILFGGRTAVRFDRVALNIAAARLARNLVLSMGAGMQINLAEIPAASLAIENSTVVANRTGINVSAGTIRVQDCEITGGEETGDGIFLAPNIVPDTLTDGQIIGNTIFDLSGAGIRIGGQHNTLFIKRNMIRDCGQAGITTTADASVLHLAIDNNAIENIGLNATGGFAVGVALTTVASGQVVGNAIRNVGTAAVAGQTYAAIAVQGGGSVDVSSNVISDIGGTQAESSSAGVLATLPFVGITIGSNRVIGRLDQTDAASGWNAIRIGPLISGNNAGGDIGNAATGFVGNLPGISAGDLVYFHAADTTWMATANSFRATVQLAPVQITCRGNQARTRQRVTGPIVSVVAAGAQALAFSDNQVELMTGGGVSEVVLLASPRMTVSGNTITHSVDALSLRMITGGKGAAAPVGNITTAGISLNNASLPAPFAALNPNG